MVASNRIYLDSQSNKIKAGYLSWSKRLESDLSLNHLWDALFGHHHYSFSHTFSLPTFERANLPSYYSIPCSIHFISDSSSWPSSSWSCQNRITIRLMSPGFIHNWCIEIKRYILSNWSIPGNSSEYLLCFSIQGGDRLRGHTSRLTIANINVHPFHWSFPIAWKRWLVFILRYHELLPELPLFNSSPSQKVALILISRVPLNPFWHSALCRLLACIFLTLTIPWIVFRKCNCLAFKIH